MKTIKTIQGLLLLLLCCCLFRAAAQSPGVMHLPDNSFNTYLDLGIELKNDLLDTGNPGEATVEFWTRSTQSGNLWTLTDINPDAEHFSVSMAGENQLSIQLGAQSHTIDLTGIVQSNLWHHIALVISENSQQLEVYVNGLKKSQFNMDLSGNRQLFFYKQAGTELLITELRGWSKKRSASAISDNQWLTFVTRSPGQLTALKNDQGLKVFYGDDDAQTTTPLVENAVTELSRTGWKNIQGDAYDATCISSYEALTLAGVSTEVNHPILNLEDILLTATKGEFFDKVQLQWPHIRDVDGYHIFRDEQLIGSQDAAGIGISDLLTYNDENILPSDIHSYRVEGYNNSNAAFSVEGTDRGFICPNGSISGHIATESTVFVAGVELRATGAYPTGSALEFGAGDSPLTVNSIEVFRGQPDFTVEFWYKGAASPSGTPFTLGNASIAFNAGNINVTNGDGSAYLNATAPADAQWHQYAVVFSTEGGAIYQDGALLTETATAFSINLSQESEFAFNAVAPAAAYNLDEFKVWDDALSAETIASRYDHICSGNEAGLLLYYRFDLEDTYHIYNQANPTKSRYIGVSDTALTWLSAGEQPPMVYGTYTNASGNYTLAAINAGTDPLGLAFTVTPSKPNHTFNPETSEVTLKRSLNLAEYEKTADFTDISSLPIAGKVLYVEDGGPYPVPSGQSILLDGNPVVGADPALVTDAFGSYSISAPLGLHSFEVNNTPQTRYFGNHSLYLHNGWAQTHQLLTDPGALTLSGWVKRGSFTDSIPALQTLLRLGELKLVLKDNERLAVRLGDNDILVSSVILGDDFSFFGFSIDKTTATVRLYVAEIFQVQNNAAGVAAADFSGYLIAGADGTPGDPAYPFTGYIDHLEYRNLAYDQDQLKAIKDGELITGDQQALVLSYPFDQVLGKKAISATAQGWQNYLYLQENAAWSGEYSVPYTRKFNYDYIAGNAAYNPQGSSYELNIIEPVTDLDFENQTRYGFVGNIIIPCENNVGAWTGTITRTDVIDPSFSKTIDATNFNSDFTLFKVEGLLPGSYSISLSNQVDNRTQQLQSPVIDISQGWVSYDFEFRNRLQVATTLYQWDTEKDSIGVQLNVLCNDTYELQASREYLVMVDVFEQYGEAACPVAGAEVNIYGDMGVLGSGFSAVTGEEGRIGLIFAANKPNFTEDYTRALQITATHDNRDPNTTLSSYNTGSVQENNNFTIEHPTVSMILHDPPGDGSSLTVTKAFSFSHEYNYAAGTEIGTEFNFGSGNSNESFVGVGVLYKMLATLFNVGVGNSTTFTYKTTGGNSTEYSLEQSVSTSSSDIITGLDADVYIGLGTVISFGTGKTLSVDGNSCTPQVADNVEVARFEDPTPFVYTHQDIKDVLLVQLDLLKQDAAVQGNQNDVDNYQHQIDTWNAILAENEAKRDAIASLPGFDSEKEVITETEELDLEQPFSTIQGIPENISFSGLTEQTYQFYKKKSDSDGSIFGGSSGLIQKTETEINISTTYVNFDIESRVIGLRETTKDTTNTRSGGYSFTLTDDDPGDQFNVDIKKDDRYGTPIFGVTAGQSGCPFEAGTQPREGVELVSDQYEIHALTGETAVYNLSLRNTQLAVDNTPKQYFIDQSDGGNPDGAVIRYNGDPLGNGLAIDFGLDAGSPVGVQQELQGQLTITHPEHVTGDVSYVDIPVVMYSGCEAEGFAYLYRQDELAGLVKLVDTIYVTAHFKAPCVDAITVEFPTNQWVVNSNSNNQMELVFRVPGLTDMDVPGDLTKVRVEYAYPGNNAPYLLEEIDLATLQSEYDTGDEYIRHTLDVGGLADGDYMIRLTPQCGSGGESWRTSNATGWLQGSIRRIAPVITEVYPPHNSVMTGGTISASYDRDLFPSAINSLNVSLRGILGGYEYIPKSAEFNEVTDQITVPHQEAIALDSAYTVEFWINPSVYANNGDKVPVIEKGQTLGIYLTHDGKIDNGRVVSSGSLIPFKWTHVAVVYDGDHNVKTYFDTQLVAQDDNIVSYQTAMDDLTIGATLSGDAFRGQLDEIRIWSRARSVAELATDYTARLLGNEDGLAAYYVLDDIAPEGECVRDFTGNTYNTMAEGITWVEGDAAAPINVEKVVQDVPVDVILSGGDQILIVPKSSFPEYYLEGAELTAFITDDKIEDLYNNPAIGKSWSFVINKNAVQWAQNNHTLNQSEGVGSTFDMELSNNGAIDVTYQFIDLPVWLNVSNDPGSGSLPYGFTHPISFEVAQWLNPGAHETYVTADVLDSQGGRIGTESFFLEVNVTCPDPGYSFNPNAYPDLINLNATLNIAGELSRDENDKVYAYLNGELRGIGQVSLTGDQYLVSMIIYGNFGDSGSLDFRVWDASECKEYQSVIENHSYQSGVNIGSLAVPATLTTGALLSKNLPLPAGFSWVSFNLKDTGADSLSLSAVTGFSTGDQITGQQGGTATYDATSGWSGTLTVLDPKQHYLLSLSQATTLMFQGEPVSINTDIPLGAGTTWAGYIPEEMILTGRAVISLSNTTATNGDQVQGQEGFAEFLDGEWIGSLTHLSPGQGYRITSTQTGTLNYFGIAGYSPKAAPAAKVPLLESPLFEIREHAAQKGWKVNANSYPETMYITGVMEDNALDSEQEHIIAAFAGEQCRGVAVPQRIDGRLYYFMTVYGHNTGEELSFKLIDGQSGKQYLLDNMLGFAPGQSEGAYKTPYAWKIGREMEELQASGDYRLYQAYPNPFSEFTTIGYELPEASEVEITVSDMTGRRIKTLVKTRQEEGSYQVTWYRNDAHGSSVTSGVYIILMETSKSTLYHKVIVK